MLGMCRETVIRDPDHQLRPFALDPFYRPRKQAACASGPSTHSPTEASLESNLPGETAPACVGSEGCAIVRPSPSGLPLSCCPGGRITLVAGAARRLSAP